jgi:hypothetical protein
MAHFMPANQKKILFSTKNSFLFRCRWIPIPHACEWKKIRIYKYLLHYEAYTDLLIQHFQWNLINVLQIGLIRTKNVTIIIQWSCSQTTFTFCMHQLLLVHTLLRWIKFIYTCLVRKLLVHFYLFWRGTFLSFRMGHWEIDMFIHWNIEVSLWSHGVSPRSHESSLRLEYWRLTWSHEGSPGVMEALHLESLEAHTWSRVEAHLFSCWSMFTLEAMKYTLETV